MITQHILTKKKKKQLMNMTEIALLLLRKKETKRTGEKGVNQSLEEKRIITRETT